MAIGQELMDALQSFATVERDIVTLGNSTNADNAADLVRNRRDLVLEFAKLSNALEHDPRMQAHPDKLTEATRLFAAFRSANAINQASWPAIRVRDNVEEYRVAARPVGEKSQAFWNWVAMELDFRR